MDRPFGYFFSVALFVVISLGGPAPVAVGDQVPAFTTGEKLFFALRWEAVPAGQAVLEVHPPQEVNGEPSRHFLLTVESNRFVDLFYKVRNRIDAYTNMALTRSVLYCKRQQEGDHQRNITVSFDWDNQTAQYDNNGKTRDPIALRPGSFDPLAAFYFVRLLDLKADKIIKRPITDGKKNVMGLVRVVRRERITCPWGTFDTFLLEPDLRHVGGIFRKSKDAKIQIWITADEKHIPVRIQSRVVIGRVIGELVNVQGLSPP